MVANLHNVRKDHITFVRAANQVARQFPEAVFVVAGQGAPGDELRQDGAPLVERQRLWFLGGCSVIAELLQASTVCVLSSHSEGLSNAVLEYMAAGKPVVASDVGGMREVVLEGRTGYLVHRGDTNALADRVSFLLRNPERAEAMGECGRRYVNEKFSLSTQFAAVHELYTQLLQTAGRTRLS
jgi:glycosyltransferase involved in cell wall biosynthesis